MEIRTIKADIEEIFMRLKRVEKLLSELAAEYGSDTSGVVD
jgi:hypothetical protein